MADWLEMYHEQVWPIGDPNGLWSGRASMSDDDVVVMDVCIRRPLNYVEMTLVQGEVEEAVKPLKE